MTYLIFQMVIDKKEIVGSNQNISMYPIIRKVEADSKEMAIGKFIVGTHDIKAMQKLDVECYELSQLKTL